MLALLYVFPIVARVTGNPHWQRHLEQIGPMTAGLYIQATVGVKTLPLTPWQGLGVLAAWAFGALLLGALVLLPARRLNKTRRLNAARLTLISETSGRLPCGENLDSFFRFLADPGIGFAVSPHR